MCGNKFSSEKHWLFMRLITVHLNLEGTLRHERR
jgi:hypothetical protein